MHIKLCWISRCVLFVGHEYALNLFFLFFICEYAIRSITETYIFRSASAIWWIQGWPAASPVDPPNEYIYMHTLKVCIYRANGMIYACDMHIIYKLFRCGGVFFSSLSYSLHSIFFLCFVSLFFLTAKLHCALFFYYINAFYVSMHCVRVCSLQY